MNRFLAVLSAAELLIAAACSGQGSMSASERALISDSPEVMRVLTVDNPADSLFLRGVSADFSASDLRGDAFRTLGRKMLATVTSPGQDGVGIAAPQVGISRRLIAVQRFDKEGEPFELYANVRLHALPGDLAEGPEGCLSVPGKRGLVPRSREIVVSYVDPATLAEVKDTVRGFTAVIFQHETDHLEGILYTDRATYVYFSE